MGTWDATVLGNDTSAEVYETFLDLYDRGESAGAIDVMIDERFATSISLEEDTHNVLFARALAHWEVGTLTNVLLGEVGAAVESGAALAAYRALDASPQMIAQRSAAMVKLLAKLRVARASPRTRKKPAVPLETRFVAGSCMSFRRSASEFGGAVIVASEMFSRRGSMRVAATSLRQGTAPSFRDFERSQLHGFRWETVHGEAARYASPNGKTGRISTIGLGYDTASTRADFFALVDPFFDIVGRLPLFTQVLLGTRGWSLLREKNLGKTLAELRDEEGAISGEPLATLATLLSTRKR